MAVYTRLKKEDLHHLLSQFAGLPKRNFSYQGIHTGTVNTYYRIVYNKTHVYFLKIDEIGDWGRLKNEIAIFSHLKKYSRRLSFAVPQPLRTKSGKFFVPFGRKFALLFPKIPGRAKKRLSLKQLHMVGSKMAELHRIPLNKSIKPHRFDMRGLKRTYQEIKDKLKRKYPACDTLIQQTFKRVKKIKSINSCLIHADVFPENIHWREAHFYALLDFEAAGLGPALFDLCVAIHALCARGGINKKMAESLISGYERLRPLSPQERQAFNDTLILTALRFLLTRLRDFALKGMSPHAKNFKDYREYERRLRKMAANTFKLVDTGTQHLAATAPL